jgi:hypothetical protein
VISSFCDAEAFDALTKEPDISALHPGFLTQNDHELLLSNEFQVNFNQYVGDTGLVCAGAFFYEGRGVAGGARVFTRYLRMK